MKYPLWILNSALLASLVGVIIFIIFSNQSEPTFISLAPHHAPPSLKDNAVINLQAIYTNDLFGTYQEPPSANPVSMPTTLPMPTPPPPRPVIVPLAEPSKFLDPLPISLRGVIALSEEDDNVALIEDNQSKATKNYSVGDKIGDGYVIRIARNRFTILRSNGQQETLYVTSDDPELTRMLQSKDWSSIVQQQNSTQYLINPYELIKHIGSIATFIDTFNITTVYHNGVSVGCRIGALEPTSLPAAFGFRPGDIITALNGEPVATTQQRLSIYEKIKGLSLQDTIEVTLQRAQKTILLLYTLSDTNNSADREASSASTASPVAHAQTTYRGNTKTPQEITNDKERILQDRYKFAPTAKELRRHEHNVIKEYQQKNRRGQGNLLNALPKV